MASPTTGIQPARETASAAAEQALGRLVIQYPAPAVDDGRFPAKRCVGDRVAVQADVFRDGHDILRAVVRYRGPDERAFREAEMRPIDAHLDGVRWAGEFAWTVGVHG